LFALLFAQKNKRETFHIFAVPLYIALVVAKAKTQESGADAAFGPKGGPAGRRPLFMEGRFDYDT